MAMAANWPLYSKAIITSGYQRVKALLLLGLLLATHASQAQVLQFIYIEASEGNSSGGHVAVQLAQDVYHYQYEDSLIRLFRQNAKAFRANYQLRQNRSLHIADIELSSAAYQQVSAYIHQRYFEQTQHVLQLKAARNDEALFQALVYKQTHNSQALQALDHELPMLPGAGLFYSKAGIVEKNHATGCGSASAQVFAGLKQHIADAKGTEFLSQKLAMVNSQLQQLTPNFGQDYAYSEKYVDLLNGVLAAQVLQNAHSLLDSACFQLRLPQGRLSATDIQQTQLFKRQLMVSALSLLKSKRPDWGYALFVALARLAVVEKTLQSGYWVFLDDTDDTTAAIPKQQLAFYRHYLQKQQDSDLKHLQEGLLNWSTTHDEIERYYAHLEIAANRYRQWQLGNQSQGLRLDSEQILPNKPLALMPLLRTGLAAAQLTKALQAQSHVVESLHKQDEADNSYHLVSKNCVTALIELLNKAAGQPKLVFGGDIDPRSHFIPFQAFDAVVDKYRVSKVYTLPAYRQQRLEGLYQREWEGLVYARESNIFSSSLYQHNPDDAWFVFFTDDAIWPRPLFGAVNTVAATGQSVAGLLQLPFDGGKQITTGLRGVLASLPELLFFNIRKGSYPYAIDP